MRSTSAWGGEPEVLALSRAYNVPIHVVQGGAPSVVVHGEDITVADKNHIVYISYHRRLYGLGEVKLRPRISEKTRTDLTAFPALQLLAAKVLGQHDQVCS